MWFKNCWWAYEESSLLVVSLEFFWEWRTNNSGTREDLGYDKASYRIDD